MPKGVPNKKYAPEFNTDRIYLRESLKALVLFRGHPKKPPKAVEEDLLAEVQRLQAKNEYLKNLQALVLEGRARLARNTQVVQN